MPRLPAVLFIRVFVRPLQAPEEDVLGGDRHAAGHARREDFPEELGLGVRVHSVHLGPEGELQTHLQADSCCADPAGCDQEKNGKVIRKNWKKKEKNVKVIFFKLE